MYAVIPMACVTGMPGGRRDDESCQRKNKARVGWGSNVKAGDSTAEIYRRDGRLREGFRGRQTQQKRRLLLHENRGLKGIIAPLSAVARNKLAVNAGRGRNNNTRATCTLFANLEVGLGAVVLGEDGTG